MGCFNLARIGIGSIRIQPFDPIALEKRYDFTVRGERYRGSTKETNETSAQKAAALKLAAAVKGSDPLDRKPPTLREYAKDFLKWVEAGRLEADTRRYY